MFKKMPPDSLGSSLILQQDDDPKHTANSIKEFNRRKKLKILNWLSLSPDLNPTKHAFHQLKRRLTEETHPKTSTWLHYRLGKAFRRMKPKVW